VLHRAASGNVFSEEDYDRLVEDILTPRGDPAMEAAALDHPAPAEPDGRAATIVSIANPEHVNALSEESALDFGLEGLTVVYGDNGSGKSGYARVLKGIARSRHREPILSDVFRDGADAKPKARVTVRVGGQDSIFDWPSAVVPEAQRMLFYDDDCRDAYISKESDFPFRPSGLHLMDALVAACSAVRTRIEARLASNAESRNAVPTVPEDLRDTEVGRFVLSLSASSGIESFLARSGAALDRLDEIRAQETQLRSFDTTKARQRLLRLAEKLRSLANHLRSLNTTLGDENLAALEATRGELRSLEETAHRLARTFESEPLRGVGTSAWEQLWDSARKYSESFAYPSDSFPVTTEMGRCVLCQQPLGGDARDRLRRFERFVKDDTQTKLLAARSKWEVQTASIDEMLTLSEPIAATLKDLVTDHPALVEEVRSTLDVYEAGRAAVVMALPGFEPLPRLKRIIEDLLVRLESAAQAAATVADTLSSPEKAAEALSQVTAKRKELEFLRDVRAQQATIAKEIVRLKEREVLENAKNSAATGPITNKVRELAETSITQAVRGSFERESQHLRVDRVCMAKIRLDKGAVLHQPTLIGTRQQVPVARVLSEGERTALGLAAFFTEVSLDTSKSAVILDDPVCSLDHIRRVHVAHRLADLARERQVIVTTHDVAFVADLKQEAQGVGVVVTDRCITRSRGNVRPGVCTDKHPWKAKDGAQRLNELRVELARIKREMSSWEPEIYEKEVASWAGGLSETWERILRQETVGQISAEGGTEVRPAMTKVLSRFTEEDGQQFQASYHRVSQWARRHDKSGAINYVAPDHAALAAEIQLVAEWHKRVKAYQSG
jgi:energy-coupling factor transporter ATP-binding protein EcfA2